MEFVDTHAHLDDEAFAGETDAVIARAAAAGVTRIVNVGFNQEGWETSTALVRQYAGRGLYLALGIHPNYAQEATPATLAALRDRCTLGPARPRVVALGETGLDYYRTYCPPDQQRAAFRAHLALARDLDLPVIIHDRDAHGDIMAILREDGAGTRGVMHSFSGDLAMAEECLARGYLISLSGPVTFPKAADRHAIARAVPLDALLLETDCPYLTPHPHRGRRNEPGYIPLMAAAVAALRGIPVAEVAAATTANAERLFQLGVGG
jgi:TatD DNase family protein